MNRETLAAALQSDPDVIAAVVQVFGGDAAGIIAFDRQVGGFLGILADEIGTLFRRGQVAEARAKASEAFHAWLENAQVEPDLPAVPTTVVALHEVRWNPTGLLRSTGQFRADGSPIMKSVPTVHEPGAMFIIRDAQQLKDWIEARVVRLAMPEELARDGRAVASPASPTIGDGHG